MKGHNEKIMFAYHLQRIKWDELYHIEPCEDKVRILQSTLQDLYDNWFPVTVVTRHDKDKPWVTEHFKSLICRRQRAKEAGDLVTFRNNLRNQVNRLAPKLKPTFYQKKISHLKRENNRHWWKDMKNLFGLGSNDNSPLQKLAIEKI